MKGARYGLARMQVALIIVVLVVAAGAGAYALLMQGSNGASGSQEIRLKITETDPVNQIDSFVPANITVKQGTTVTFAVQNGDDEIRVMTVAGYNLNFTILAGTTQRVTFLADQTGTFKMFSPQTVPSAASVGKPGSPVTGYLTVTS
jgi:plastocyanin